MKISERYATARNTSNLESNPRTKLSASDVLAAVGMAGQGNPEAVAMLNLAFGGKPSAKLAFTELLANRLTVQMLKAGWTGDPKKTAKEALGWWLHGTCMPCGGTRYERIPGTPSLSDRVCKHCGGSGKLLLGTDQALLWTVDLIDRLTSIADHAVRKKVA